MTSHERPRVLYHGSPNKEIGQLEPRNLKVRSQEEGPVIFATPDKAGAMKNLLWSDDSWTQLSTHNGTHVVLIAAERDEFIRNDVGGACYEVPGEGFMCDPKFPTGGSEWTSRDAVTPLAKEIYPSALDAMIEHGVQVYFVDPSTLKKYQDAEDKFSIVSRLMSENEKRGLPKPDFIER